MMLPCAHKSPSHRRPTEKGILKNFKTHNNINNIIIISIKFGMDWQRQSTEDGHGELLLEPHAVIGELNFIQSLLTPLGIADSLCVVLVRINSVMQKMFI